MFAMKTGADHKPSWQELFQAVSTAQADLDADDVDTDDLMDFYSDALTQALMDFMLAPVSTADALHAKMKLFAEHEMQNLNPTEFDEIWAVLMADVIRIGGPAHCSC